MDYVTLNEFASGQECLAIFLDLSDLCSLSIYAIQSWCPLQLVYRIVPKANNSNIRMFTIHVSSFKYNDVADVSDAHRRSLRLGEEVSLGPFRFRAKDGRFLRMRASWKRFRNPWTQEIDYLVSRWNSILSLSLFCKDKSTHLIALIADADFKL